MRVHSLLGVMILLTACASQQQTQTDNKTNELGAHVQAMIEGAKKRPQERRGNENWSVWCHVYKVTKSRLCWAGTFGQFMNYDGRGYGKKSIPFKVYFLDKTGPFVEVGWHNYPGKHATVSIDENDPVEVNYDGGVSVLAPDEHLVQQLRSGKIARARYHVWPHGPEDMIVDLTGFEEAWQRLLQRKSELQI